MLSIILTILTPVLFGEPPFSHIFVLNNNNVIIKNIFSNLFIYIYCQYIPVFNFGYKM